ncbi:MAG: SH3 domain-containing protein [Leptospira sp.]|nr:SH3 domain-containing protein [Leptospira sp.]
MIKYLIKVSFFFLIFFFYCKENSKYIFVRSHGKDIAIRSMPAISSKEIRKVPDGTKVEILTKKWFSDTVDGKNGTWYEIKFQGEKGWVFSSHLNIDAPDAPKATPIINEEIDSQMVFNGFSLPSKYYSNSGYQCYIYPEYTILESRSPQGSFTVSRNTSSNTSEQICSTGIGKDFKMQISEALDSHFLGFSYPYFVIGKNKKRGIEQIYVYDATTSASVFNDFVESFEIIYSGSRNDILGLKYRTVYGKEFRNEIKCDICTDGKSCMTSIVQSFGLNPNLTDCADTCQIVKNSDGSRVSAMTGFVTIDDIRKPGSMNLATDSQSCSDF